MSSGLPAQGPLGSRQRLAGTLNAPIRVALIHSDPALHFHLRNAIAGKAKRWELIWVPDARNAFAGLEDQRPDVVLLDARVGSREGLRLARRLRRASPDLPVVLLAPEAMAGALRGFGRLGVQGLVITPIEDQRLLEAIGGAVQGAPALSAEAARMLGGSDPSPERPRRSPVPTERERFVMEHIAKRWHEKEIAAALGIAASTVHAHRTKAYRKLGARGRREAVRRFRRAEAKQP